MVVKSLTGFSYAAVGLHVMSREAVSILDNGGRRDRRETVRIYNAMMERSGILAYRP